MRLPVATSAIDFDTKAQEADENGHSQQGRSCRLRRRRCSWVSRGQRSIALYSVVTFQCGLFTSTAGSESPAAP